MIEPDLDKMEELARIAFNLRYFTKVWKEQYGAKNKINMNYWEDKIDSWFKENIVKVAPEETDQELSERENNTWRGSNLPPPEIKKAS